jgi:hypothetical protein
MTMKNPLCEIMTTATTTLAATTHDSAGNQPANSPPIFAPRAMTKMSIPRPTPLKVSTTIKDHPHAGTFPSNHNHKITQKPTEQHPPLVSNYIDKTKCTGGDPPLSNHDKAQSKANQPVICPQGSSHKAMTSINKPTVNTWKINTEIKHLPNAKAVTNISICFQIILAKA